MPDGAPGDASDRASTAVLAHCRALIDATAGSCVAVKPQLARFEALGVQGNAVLREVCAHARELGLLVIADGKRGDIDVTATAYAGSLLAGIESPFGHLEGLGADLITVNPLMGRDAIEPFVAAARAAGAGVLILVRTSNPGAADIEDLELAEGGTVWERTAKLVEELGRPGVGASGLSDVGAVVGATAPAHLQRARELMAEAVFLLPGIGAQGGPGRGPSTGFRAGPCRRSRLGVPKHRRRPPQERRRTRRGRRGRGRASARRRLERSRKDAEAEPSRGRAGSPHGDVRWFASL